MNKLKVLTGVATLAVMFVFSACGKSSSANSGGRPSATTATTASPANTPTPTPSPSPKSASGAYQKALENFKAKKFDEAEAGFREVVAAEPKHADAHFYLGRILFDKKEPEASLPHFEQAAKIDFKSVDKLLALGENQRTLKKYDLAAVQFGKVIGFDPEKADAYFGLGLTYVGLNNKIAAGQQHRKLDSLDKGMAETLKKAIDGMK